MKFFHLASAWTSVVTIGQEAADDFVEIGDLQQALQLLETLLPVVQQHALDGLVIGLRFQRAVVSAHTGDYAAARAELDIIQCYDVPLQQAREIANQRVLIERLAIQSRPAQSPFKPWVLSNAASVLAAPVAEYLRIGFLSIHEKRGSLGNRTTFRGAGEPEGGLPCDGRREAPADRRLWTGVRHRNRLREALPTPRGVGVMITASSGAGRTYREGP